MRAEVQSADAADDGAERVKGEIDGMCFHVGANNKQLETPDFDALLPLPSRHFRRCASASSFKVLVSSLTFAQTSLPLATPAKLLQLLPTTE